MNIFSSSPYSSRVLAAIRIVAGLLFMSYGTMKLFGWPPGLPPGMHIALFSKLGLAGVLETFGGLCIVLGLLTRPVAFILSGEMAVAYFTGHFPKSPFPTVNMGSPAILYCFLFFYLAFVGAGPWSLDRIIAKGRTGLGRAP